MPLYKQKDSPYWWTRFTLNGQRIRRTTRTKNKKQAELFEKRLREETWDLQQSCNLIWQDAVTRWLDENEHKRAIDKDRIILSWLRDYLNDIQLTAINRSLLETIRKAKADETSPATANRYMALVRAILNTAKDDWEWIHKAPKVPMYPIEPTDYQWLARDEFDALLKELPKHTQQLARFAVATGLRRTNITHLQWRQVDMKRGHLHITAAASKSKKAISVPLNADAMAILSEQKGLSKVWVFPYQGKPVYQVSTKAWRKAVTDIGRPGFRFHDLRHTWASWHVQAGTPLHALQKLGGWSSYEMVLRYAHLDGHSLAGYAENVVSACQDSDPGNDNGNNGDPKTAVSH